MSKFAKFIFSFQSIILLFLLLTVIVMAQTDLLVNTNSGIRLYGIILLAVLILNVGVYIEVKLSLEQELREAQVKTEFSMVEIAMVLKALTVIMPDQAAEINKVIAKLNERTTSMKTASKF